MLLKQNGYFVMEAILLFLLMGYQLLTYCILVDSSTVLCWLRPFIILGMLDLYCHFYSAFYWKILSANNVDLDQIPQYVESDLDLHCLPMTHLWEG